MTTMTRNAPGRQLTPSQGAVKMFFRGAWAGVFAGPTILAMIITVLFFVGLSTRRDMTFPGMDLTMLPDENFQLAIDLRPILASAVIGAILLGVAAAVYGYRRIAQAERPVAGDPHLGG